uniref:Uncharacterized protein n=1 Tax=Anguilla anguilla TaxID=7936 RepID=A0A0E9W7E9_ANGAN
MCVRSSKLRELTRISVSSSLHEVITNIQMPKIVSDQSNVCKLLLLPFEISCEGHLDKDVKMSFYHAKTE